MKPLLVAGLMVCLWAPRAGAGTAVPDSGCPHVVDKTLILPAWGSWGQGNVVVTGAQLALDALAVLLISSDAPSSQPGGGVGAGLGILCLAANRLVSIPLNRNLASKGDEPPPAPPSRPPDALPRRQPMPNRHLGFGFEFGLGDYSSDMGIALDSKWVRADFGFDADVFNGEVLNPQGGVNYTLQRIGYWGFGLAGKIPLTRALSLDPGGRVLVKHYQYYNGVTHKNPTSFDVIPDAALIYRPFVPVSFEAGFGYAVVRSSVERRLLEDGGIVVGDFLKDSRLRSRFGIKVYLF